MTEMTCTGVSGLSPLSVGTLLINITISMPDDTLDERDRGKECRDQSGSSHGI